MKRTKAETQCKFCRSREVEWELTPVGYRLRDIGGSRHFCGGMRQNAAARVSGQMVTPVQERAAHPYSNVTGELHREVRPTPLTDYTDKFVGIVDNLMSRDVPYKRYTRAEVTSLITQAQQIAAQQTSNNNDE